MCLTRYTSRTEAETTVVITLEDGREVRVKLLEVEPGRARLGIDAPPSVRIDRAERLPVARREG